MDPLIKELGPSSYVPPPPTINSYWTTPNPVVKAERNAKGDLIGEYVTTKYTVKWKYKEIDADDFADLYEAANNEGAYFNTYMEFWSFQEKAYKTGYFYAAAITSGLNSDDQTTVSDVEVEMIEM